MREPPFARSGAPRSPSMVPAPLPPPPSPIARLHLELDEVLEAVHVAVVELRAVRWREGRGGVGSQGTAGRKSQDGARADFGSVKVC